jgi:hypothetical protein
MTDCLPLQRAAWRQRSMGNSHSAARDGEECTMITGKAIERANRRGGGDATHLSNAQESCGMSRNNEQKDEGLVAR